MSAKAAPEAKTSQTPEAKSARSFTAAPKPMLLRKCACGSSSGGGCEECSKNHLPLQRSATSHDSVGSIPPIVNETLSSPGRPLEAPTRNFMESRFGHDFSQVRIHTDSQAAESARAVHAHAYTVGQDIVFASDHYRPESSEGMALLAHELAHTIQQRGLQRAEDGVRAEDSSQRDHLEHEAASAAAAVVQGQTARITPQSSLPALSRAPWGTCPTGKVMDARASNIHESAELFMVEHYREARGEKLISNKNVPFETLTSSGTVGEMIAAAVKDFRGKPFRYPRRQTSVDPTAIDESRAQQEAAPPEEFPLLRPDFMDFREHVREVYDVTTEKQSADKVNKVAGYVDLLETIRKANIILGKQWSAGKTLPRPKVISFPLSRDQKHIIICFGTTDFDARPGVISYQPIDTSQPPDETAEQKEAPAAETEPYPISAQGKQVTLVVPKGGGGKKKAEKIPIHQSSTPENAAAAELIPGLILKSLNRGPKGKDTIEAAVDTEKLKLPITIEGKKETVLFNVGKDGELVLAPASKKPNLDFNFKFLSPGRITTLALNESGEVDWGGYINPGVPFLGRLDVSYSKGELKVTKGLDPETLKKKSFLGAKITRAEVNLYLAPEFKPEGVIEFELGKELATGVVTVTKDDVGLVAKGKLKLAIPKVDTAETDIIYRAGEGRNEWEALINIQSSQIKLPYVTGGSLTGRIAKNVLDFDGKVEFTLPNNRGVAEAGLGYSRSGGWRFHGKGTFRFPKLDPTKVEVLYFAASEKLIAKGETGFTIEAIKLKGELKNVTFTASKGGNVSVSGEGRMEIRRGKTQGSAEVKLHPNGKFTGKGAITYQLKPDLTISGTVELDEKEKLRITGSLTFARFKLFDGHHPKPRNLFSLNLSIPIPGASIGSFGLKFKLGGGADVNYGFGPGVIEPLIFEAGFDPLEEDPDLTLGVSGKLKIPAFAELTAFIKGGLSIDALIAEAGGELELRGTIRLEGGLFADFKAQYARKKFTAELTPEIKAELILILALLARVYAEAGFWRLKVRTEKTWKLGEKRVPTGLGFQLSAPFGYDSDTGIKLPSPEQITLKRPEITTDKMIDIAKQLFGSAKEDTKES